MSMEIIGFEEKPLYRWSALLTALNHFGEMSFKVGVISDPVMIGEKVVCAKVSDFGMIFRPDEIDRISRTHKRVQEDFPAYAGRALDVVQGAADDARFGSASEKRRMI